MSTSVQHEFIPLDKGVVNVKVALLGDTATGKTALVNRFVDDKFDDDYVDTLGVSFAHKSVEVQGQEIRFSIWDVAGGQRASDLTTSSVQLVSMDADAVVLVFDLTRRASLWSAKEWMRSAVASLRTAHRSCVFIIVGTKWELFRELPPAEKTYIVQYAKAFADKIGAPLVFTSSAEKINVTTVFQIIIARRFGLNPMLDKCDDINAPILLF
eukprot:GDKK01022664.1.p1 GENE.GDKK01022664.1~~GDKK01022664.1.p1  ORF type:complete len:222 (-),score=18.75 GDKK01022664.1:72-707(-)